MQAIKMAQMAIEHTALGGVETTDETTMLYYCLAYNTLFAKMMMILQQN